jgi:hypothetical protein
MTLAKVYCYCGRDFTQNEIDIIRKIVSDDPVRTRSKISKRVCQALGWVKPNGGLKDMSCRVAMLRMYKDGLISLPPARNTAANRKYCRIENTPDTAPGSAISEPAGKLKKLELRQVASQKQSRLWNEYIHRYHYLGFKPLPGAQLRYFVYSGNFTIALLGFGAAAWKVAPRDQFVGWSPKQRKQKLHLIVNNARFLILPWINSKNLASKILSMASKQLPKDWLEKYNYQPLLLETFVQKDRFEGTCYKAANWVYVGTTKGRGKLDRQNKARLPQKNIWLYPLCKKFKKLLCY